MSLCRTLKNKDLQTSNVILDFRDLKVLKCSMEGTVVPKDWDRVLAYYYQHYKATIDRLLKENGYEIIENDSSNNDQSMVKNET
jgi:hypothetical protein